MRWLWRRLGNRGVALWLSLVALLLLEYVTLAGSDSADAPPWWHPVVGATGIAVAVGVRRSRPVLSLAVAVALALAQMLWAAATDGPFVVSSVVVLGVVSWLAGRHSDRTRGFVAVMVTGNLLVLPVGLPLLGEQTLSTAILAWLVIVFQSLLVVVLPWLLGRYRRQQVQLISAGWERAERMEHEQQMQIDRARLRERARIAQDMHDSLGHELSLIALRAGALEVTPGLDERHRAAATELRTSAGTATARLSEIIGLLRDSDDPAPLQPADEGVGDLVEHATASGMVVRLFTTGPAAAAPSAVGQALHRIVQEALTNAAKHAPGAPVTVELRHAGDATRVRVSNEPPTRAPETTPASGGHGLPGLEQRARLLGGSVGFGPVPGGGYAVSADLPHAGAGAPAGAYEQSESAAARETARRQARRGLLTAVVAPLALATVIGALMLGFYVAIGYGSVLEPARYEQLRVGQSRAEVEPLLPPIQMLDAPSEEDVPPPPPGATCEFYRPDGPFSITYVYRLCFADGRLVQKDVIQTGETPVEQEDAG